MDGETTSESGPDVAKQWIAEIQYAEKHFEQFHKTGDRIIKRYRDERSYQSDSDVNVATKLNLFWSNISTLQPAIYTRIPKSVVERRFKDSDPVGRACSEILERCLTYQTDCYDFDAVLRYVRDDYLLTGRGQAWVRYVPQVQGERLVAEEVRADYIYRKDFLHKPARFWEEVTWVAKRVYLSREQAKEAFGEKIGAVLQLDYVPEELQKDSTEVDEKLKKACVYEIWDKPTKTVYWVSKSFPGATLKEEKDPLQLRNFFPCPKPLFATLTTDKLIPVPDYELYKDQLIEVDELTARMSDLTDACKAAGIYDASLEGLEQLLKSKGNQMIPVANWRSVVEGGKVDGAISWLPLETIVAALQVLQEMRQKKIDEVYEITGIADIVRGNTEPSETATAQQIKGQFATLRLSERQQAVQRFARDILELKAEIMAERFQPETLAMMSGISLADPMIATVFPEVIKLLKSDFLRNYRIDIETDSTIAVDENLDKQRRIEWLEATGRFIQQAFTIAQSMPTLTPALTEMVLFTTRGFRTGRPLESTLEQAFNGINQQVQQQMQAQANQPPPPDPKVIEVQAKAELEQQKMQLEMKVAEHKAQLEIAKLQAQQSLEAEKARIELAMKAEALQNTPENAETQATIEQTAPAQVMPPFPPIEINVNVAKPGKKVARLQTDPVTGEGTAVVEDVIEEPQVTLA